MIQLPALPSKGLKVLASIRPVSPEDGRYYQTQTIGESIHFQTLKTPAAIIQRTDTTCWAAAMDCLFRSTQPIPVSGFPAVNNAIYSEENNIARVTDEEEIIKKGGLLTRTLPLLNRPGNDLRTSWSSLPQVNYVYETVFKLSAASVIQANKLKSKLVEWISANTVPILTYSEGKPSWRNEGAWSWHAIIIWMVAEAKNGTELWVKAMDPASGKYLACKLEETMGGTSEWFYYGTTRRVGEPLPQIST